MLELDGAVGEDEAVGIVVKLEFGRVVEETEVEIELGTELGPAVVDVGSIEVLDTKAADGAASLDRGKLLNAGS